MKLSVVTFAIIAMGAVASTQARYVVDMNKRDDLTFKPLASGDGSEEISASQPKQEPHKFTLGLFFALGYLLAKSTESNLGYGQYGVTQPPYYTNSGNTIVHVGDGYGYPGYGYGYGGGYGGPAYYGGSSYTGSGSSGPVSNAAIYHGTNQLLEETAQNHSDTQALYKLVPATQANLPKVVTKPTQVVVQATKVSGPPSATGTIPVTMTLYPPEEAQRRWATKIQSDYSAQAQAQGSQTAQAQAVQPTGAASAQQGGKAFAPGTA